MGKLKTQEQFESELKEKFPRIKVLGKYTGGNDPIECICEIDDYHWNPRAYNVIKSGCPCCNGNRMTLKSFKKKLESLHPEVNVLTESVTDINQHTKLDCVCKVCGLKFNKELIAVKKWGCARCNTNYHNSRGLTQEEYCQKIYELYGEDIEVLGHYKTNDTKILHKCNLHNYEWNALPRTLLSGMNSCKYCSGRMRSDGKRRTLEDLKDKIWELYGDEYEVLDKTYIDCHHKMKFMHNPLNGKSHTVISSPTRILHQSTGCPVCSGMQISEGYNDIGTTDPDMAKLFLNSNDAKIFSRHSNKKAYFKCPHCNYIIYKSVNVVGIDKDIHCPICSDGISYPNKLIYNCLLQIIDKLDFLEREYKPDWCQFDYKGKQRKGYYDIYFGINNKRYIIEMDGGFHFKTHPKDTKSLDEIKYIDNIKSILAEQQGIPVIRIDSYYGRETKDKFKYIYKNIIESELSSIIDLDKINFEEANLKSQKSYIVECAKYWEQGLTSREIKDLLNINITSVSVYLNTAAKIGLCNYTGNDGIRRTSALKVICLNTREIFESVTNAGKFYNVDSGTISQCCKGEAFSAGKHKETNERLFWMYYKDYERLSEEEISKYINNKYDFAYKTNLMGRRVICTTTNKVFISVMEASRSYHVVETGIRKCCKGEIKTSGKLKDGTRLQWRYYDDYIKEFGEVVKTA